MGLMDGLIGGAVGAEMATLANSFIQRHGGVQGLVAELEQKGLGGAARSWVGVGANQPITAEQLQQHFPGVVGELAAKTGMSPQDLAARIAQVLPGVVDKLTPGGTIPPAKS